jgi:hypothetical protein
MSKKDLTEVPLATEPTPLSSKKPIKRIRRTKEELKDVYIDPLEMEKLIVEYYKTDFISDKLAEMIQMIAVRLGLARNFYSYSFKTEMQGDAIVKMMTALRRKRFKCNVGYNPFSYFTKVAYHAFQNCIKKSKKEYQTLQNYQEEVYENYISSKQISHKKNTTNYKNDSYYRHGHYDDQA